jgi:hypothetical protein
MKSIVSIILIIASISFFVFFTKPKWTELKQNRAEVQNLNIAQENAKKLKAKIDSLLSIKNSISPADMEKIQKMIPNNVENVKLIIDFDNILQAMVIENGTENIYKNLNNDNLGKVSIENPKISQSDLSVNGNFDPTTLGVADFKFNVSLTYRDFISFLTRIENSTRIFDINSISFSTPQTRVLSNPNDIVYDFSVDLKTYWLKSK